MKKPLVSLMIALSLAVPTLANDSLQQTGAHSYTNAGAKKLSRVMRTSKDGSHYNYVPPPKTRFIARHVPRPAAPPRAAASVGSTNVLAYAESAYRNLPSRWLAYHTWDPQERKYRETRIDINEVIERVAREEGIDPLILECIITQESGFNIRAESSVGAMGLMQLMPETAADLGCRDAWDPVENVKAGARYFADQYRYYGDLQRALAAYNAGPGNVDTYGGVPPFDETINYVANIAGHYESRKKRARA